MIVFFRTAARHVIAVETSQPFTEETANRLKWLFGNAEMLDSAEINERFIGPRREMITPWSTCAVEITQNMGIAGITRIEEFIPAKEDDEYDPMLQYMYEKLDQKIFTIDKKPDPIIYIDDIAAYNEKEGLALSDEEIAYLNELSKK